MQDTHTPTQTNTRTRTHTKLDSLKMKWVCERKAYPKQIKNAPKNAESQRKDGPKAGQRFEPA